MDEIEILWKQARTTAEKDAVKALLAPWLYADAIESRLVAKGSLRRTPIRHWGMVFKEYGAMHAYNPPSVEEEGNKVELWMRTQLFRANTTYWSLGMNHLFLMMAYLTVAVTKENEELLALCIDLVARTLSLVARGHRYMQPREMFTVDPTRIYFFLELEPESFPTEEELEESWTKLFGGNKNAEEIANKRYDPSGLRLKKAVAFALRISHPALFVGHAKAVRKLLDVRKPFDNFTVSPHELLVYVAGAHQYLNWNNPGLDLAWWGSVAYPFRVRNEIDQKILHRTTSLLVEAMGPRLDHEPTRSAKFDMLEAVRRNDLDFVLTLLLPPYSVDPDEVKDPAFGCTALIWACRWGFIRIVDLLLACGADPNLYAKESGNSLHWASSSSQPESCLRILRAGGRIESLDDGGNYPINCVGRYVGVQELDLHYLGSEIYPSQIYKELYRELYTPSSHHTEFILVHVRKQLVLGNEEKRKGNTFFGKEDFVKALKCYETALKLFVFECPVEKAVAYSNRAQCYLQLKDYANAEKEALLALMLDRNNVKAKYRLARSREMLSKTKD